MLKVRSYFGELKNYIMTKPNLIKVNGITFIDYQPKYIVRPIDCPAYIFDNTLINPKDKRPLHELLGLNIEVIKKLDRRTSLYKISSQYYKAFTAKDMLFIALGKTF